MFRILDIDVEQIEVAQVVSHEITIYWTWISQLQLLELREKLRRETVRGAYQHDSTILPSIRGLCQDLWKQAQSHRRFPRLKPGVATKALKNTSLEPTMDQLGGHLTITVSYECLLNRSDSPTSGSTETPALTSETAA